AAIGLALLAGLGAGYLIARPATRPAAAAVVVAGVKGQGSPLYVYKPGATPEPTAKDRADASALLASAHEHLARRDLDGAERSLGFCIEIADLAECHRILGALLALTEQPQARA